MKKILSMFLSLSMVLTLCPISAAASVPYTASGTNGEIIAFEPLREMEKLLPSEQRSRSWIYLGFFLSQ